jgi:hypothetical protein
MLLSDQFTLVDTRSGDAAAPEILEPKKAWVDGVELTGSMPDYVANHGCILDVQNIVGAADAAYNPSNHALLEAAGVNAWSLTNDLDVNGYSHIDSAWGQYIATGASTPAKTTSIRKYEMWGKCPNNPTSGDFGVRIIFNWIDINNYWQVYFLWSSGSGVYYARLDEVTGGSSTTRVPNQFFSSAVDSPFYWHMTVYDLGDGVIFYITGFEEDDPTNEETVKGAYTVGSRPHKTATETTFGVANDPEDQWLFRGCRISDV